MTKWKELFPEGRFIYYEGDDLMAFLRKIRAEFGFNPGSFASVLAANKGFHCPPEHLDAIYGSGRFPMGS